MNIQGLFNGLYKNNVVMVSIELIVPLNSNVICSQDWSQIELCRKFCNNIVFSSSKDNTVIAKIRAERETSELLLCTVYLEFLYRRGKTIV